ncbi:sugar phosphate isomerase/epimerase family protein [Aquirufa sp. ROCK2-A2]
MKKGLLTLFILGFLTNIIFAQNSGSKMLKETPGVVSFTFRKEFAKDMPGTLDLIQSMGIKNIEFSNLFGKTAKEIRGMLDERGMVCTSYGVTYDALSNKMNTVIEDAKILGAQFVRVGMIPHKSPFNLEAAQKAVNDFNSFGKTLRQNGLEFCYHNHGYEFLPYENGTYFDYLVQQTDPKYVSYEIDILWVHHFGQSPAELLKKYSKRFRLMHVKDLKKGVSIGIGVATSSENDVALGTGQLNIPEILQLAKKSKIKYYYLEDESSNAQKQVPEGLRFLK